MHIWIGIGVVQRVSVCNNFHRPTKLLVILAIHASSALTMGPVTPGMARRDPAESSDAFGHVRLHRQ